MAVFSSEEVEKFLSKFKRFAPKGIFPVGDVTWKDDLEKLNLIKKQRDKIILSLTAENYFRSPAPKPHQADDVWEFGYIHDGIEIYMKLKVFEKQDGVYAGCLGFHKALEPITYIYKRR
jgi:hypothetical protein